MKNRKIKKPASASLPVDEAKANPIHFKPVRFVCSKWPQLGMGGGLKFVDGFFTATTPEQVARVERLDGYGGSIIRIKEKQGRVPSVEETAEMEALEELKRSQPSAHRGVVSTSNMAG